MNWGIVAIAGYLAFCFVGLPLAPALGRRFGIKMARFVHKRQLQRNLKRLPIVGAKNPVACPMPPSVGSKNLIAGSTPPSGTDDAARQPSERR